MRMSGIIFLICAGAAILSFWLMTIHVWPWNVMYAMVFGGVFGVIIGSNEIETCDLCSIASTEYKNGRWVCDRCLQKIHKGRNLNA